MQKVESFVSTVRRRLNRNAAFDSLMRALLAGSIITLGVAAIWLFRGFQVPRELYYWAGGGTALLAVLIWYFRRAGQSEASKYADDHFDLKDTITSARSFESAGKSGGFYDLQAQTTAEKLTKLDAKRVPFVWPRAMTTAAGCAALVAGLTAFKETDPEVLARMEKEKWTKAEADAIKDELKEALEALEKSEDPATLPVLDIEGLKKLVSELEPDKDVKEMLKQFSALQQKLQEKEKALDRRAEELLLKKTAEELAKEEDPDARELARRLQLEQYREAKEKLEQMAKQDIEEGRDAKEMISEQRKELTKLRAAAKRMAAAARMAKQERQGKNSDKDGKDGKEGRDSKRTGKESKSGNENSGKEGDENSSEQESSENSDSDEQSEGAEQNEKGEKGQKGDKKSGDKKNGKKGDKKDGKQKDGEMAEKMDDEESLDDLLLEIEEDLDEWEDALEEAENDAEQGKLEPRVVYFRQGLNDYDGATDTTLRALKPDSSASGLRALAVNSDADPDATGAQASQMLIKFLDVFGDKQTQIPKNSLIAHAKLHLHSESNSEDGSQLTADVHRMLASWRGGATWKSLVDGVAADDTEAVKAPSASEQSPKADATVTFKIAQDVIGWKKEKFENNGWTVQGVGAEGDDWYVKSSEADTEEHRPTLEIGYLEMKKCDGGKARQGLGKLGGRLSALGAGKAAQSRLKGLGKQLGQYQSRIQGKGKGGLAPGSGSDETRREEKDELKDNGQTTRITGQKGVGPSLKKIEAADDGTGISTAKAKTAQQNLKKQFESFVQRQDVPEDVKEGVKNYFETIHEGGKAIQPQPGAAPQAEAPPAAAPQADAPPAAPAAPAPAPPAK